MNICDECKAEFLKIIDERMRIILDSGESESDRELNQAHCFHFYELRNVLLGKPTFYPVQKEISGPLFSALHTSDNPLNVCKFHGSDNQQESCTECVSLGRKV